MGFPFEISLLFDSKIWMVTDRHDSDTFHDIMHFSGLCVLFIWSVYRFYGLKIICHFRAQGDIYRGKFEEQLSRQHFQLS